MKQSEVELLARISTNSNPKNLQKTMTLKQNFDPFTSANIAEADM